MNHRIRRYGLPALCLTALITTAAPAAAVAGAQPPPCSPQTNDTDVQIPDRATATSEMYFSSCGGGQPGSQYSRVTVDITHTYRGDLQIDLIAQDGSEYRLKNANSTDSRDDVRETYTLNLTPELANGRWTLKITDKYLYDRGTLNTWTLSLVG